MMNKLHNLLPKEKKKSIKREYYLRLLSTFLFMFSVVVVVGIFALIPTYTKMSGDFKIKQHDYDLIKEDTTIDKTTHTEIFKTISMLSIIDGEIKKKKLNVLLKEALSSRPTDVSVTGFSYNRSANSFALQGVAKNRNILVQYAKSLENNDYFLKVPIPISDLAKNVDLEFRLSAEIADDNDSEK